MTTSRTEDDAMLLLEGFYDLSGGKLNEPVPLGNRESTEAEAAAPKAGMDPGSTGCEIAVRYLVDQGYIKAADDSAQEPDTYLLTVPGLDKVKELRGTG